MPTTTRSSSRPEGTNARRRPSYQTQTTNQRTMRVVDGALTRRLLLGAAAAFTALPVVPLPTSAAAGLSPEVLQKKLSRVPVFTITNSQASPYLTEVDAAGKRSGFFFLSPQEAVTALNDIKAFDPRASLNVVPLDQIWFDISKPVAETAAAPQPTAGTSTDLRLFRLQPLENEVAATTKLKSAASNPKLAEGDVPLFYEPTLKLTVDGAEQTPYFFRLGDLGTAYDQQLEAGQAGLNSPPTPRMLPLASVVRKLQTGELGEGTLLVAASDAAAVIQRMQGGSDAFASGEGADGGGAAAGGAAPPQVEDPFFLSVPWANGKVK